MTLLSTNLFADQIGTASWYGIPHHGKKTASGERYNMHGLSAAHRKIKLGTKVRVTNLNNNKSVVVIVCNKQSVYNKRSLHILGLCLCLKT